MKRLFIFSLAAVLCLLSVPASAASRDADIPRAELERLENQLITMLPQLSTVETERPVFRRHRKDLYSLTLTLSDEQNRALAQSAGIDGLFLLAVGQQTPIPSNPRSLSNATTFLPRQILNYWWAVYNSSLDDLVATTKLTVKGAGRSILGQTSALHYPKKTITLYWEGKNEALTKTGLYMTKVRVDGARRGESRKTFFLVKDR